MTYYADTEDYIAIPSTLLQYQEIKKMNDERRDLLQKFEIYYENIKLKHEDLSIKSYSEVKYIIANFLHTKLSNIIQREFEDAIFFKKNPPVLSHFTLYKWENIVSKFQNILSDQNVLYYSTKLHEINLFSVNDLFDAARSQYKLRLLHSAKAYEVYKKINSGIGYLDCITPNILKIILSDQAMNNVLRFNNQNENYQYLDTILNAKVHGTWFFKLLGSDQESRISLLTSIKMDLDTMKKIRDLPLHDLKLAIKEQKLKYAQWNQKHYNAKQHQQTDAQHTDTEIDNDLIPTMHDTTLAHDASQSYYMS